MSTEYLPSNFAVFNGHVRNADKRARRVLAHEFPDWLAEVEKIEEDGGGIMAIYDHSPTPATAAYVALVTLFANGERAILRAARAKAKKVPA